MELRLIMEAQSLIENNKLEEAISKLSGIKDTQNRQLAVQIHRQLGETKLLLGRREEALTDFSNHLDVCRSIGCQAGESQACLNIGRVLMKMGEHGKAREYLESVVGGVEEKGQALYLLGCIHYEGAKNAIHRRQIVDHVDYALNYFHEYYENPSSELGKSRVLNVIGNCYYIKEDYAEAFHFHTLRLKDARKSKDNLGMARAMVNRGTCLLQMGFPKKAIDSVRGVEALTNRCPRIFGRACQVLADSFQRLEEHLEAAKYYKILVKLARCNERELAEAIAGLILSLKARGEHFEVLYHSRKLIDVADRIGDEELKIFGAYNYQKSMDALGVGGTSEGDSMDSFHAIIDRLNASRMNDQRYELIVGDVTSEQTSEFDAISLEQVNSLGDALSQRPVIEVLEDEDENSRSLPALDEIFDRLVAMPQLSDQRYDLETNEDEQTMVMNRLFDRLNSRMDDQRF